MHLRRFFAICTLVLVGGILVACGSDDEVVSPTATTAPTVESTATEPAPIDVATPDATPLATPIGAEATPDPLLYTGSEEDLMKTPQILPIATDPAEFVVDDATPDSGIVAPPILASDPVEVEPEPTTVPMVEVAGTITLDGRAQQDFTLSAEGCFGLGEWRQLKPGTQVIVRDASGTVVDIASLEGHDSEDTCAWTFEIEVPGADFFSVSIPMVTEVWFDQNDPAVTSGELELFVP